jgi:ubiquinone/menaquinone biosynthesis C-methylase UbiE
MSKRVRHVSEIATELEQEQLHKYRFCYKPEQLDHSAHPKYDFFSKLAAFRVALVRTHYRAGCVLDVGCGSGHYLVELAEFVEHAVGIDFSPEMVAATQSRIRDRKAVNLSCREGNARQMEFPDRSFSLLYSFSALYYMPRLDEVLSECSRVLEKGGIAVFDFGTSHSLNTIVCRANAELAAPCHVPLKDIRRFLAHAGFEILEDHGFQILPLWGRDPTWLRPLLLPVWKRLLELEVGGHMIDQIISSTWPLRHFAFRHITVCRKTG